MLMKWWCLVMQRGKKKSSLKTISILKPGAACKAAAAVVSHGKIKRYPWSSWRLCWGFFFCAPILRRISVGGLLFLSPTLKKCQNSAWLLLLRGFLPQSEKFVILSRMEVQRWSAAELGEENGTHQTKWKQVKMKKKLWQVTEFIFAADGIYTSQSKHIGCDWWSLIAFKSLRTEQLGRLRAV